jgi:hypothetical protein
MTYMQDVEGKVRGMLIAFGAGDLSQDDIIKSVKQIVLESYRNGQNARQADAPAGAAREVAQEFKEKRSGQAPYRRTQNYRR